MVKENTFYSTLIHNISNTGAFLKGITSLLEFLLIRYTFSCVLR